MSYGPMLLGLETTIVIGAVAHLLVIVFHKPVSDFISHVWYAVRSLASRMGGGAPPEKPKALTNEIHPDVRPKKERSLWEHPWL